ncbi:MAG: glycosyltransferase family 4 protein [SAR324 cluster bacterium]|nr:glycosyltransferase family 4 protein [SAR324 cluster bacterium]
MQPKTGDINSLDEAATSFKKIKIAVVSSSFPPLSKGGISSAQYGLLLFLQKNEKFIVRGFSFCDKINATEKDISRSSTPSWIKKIVRRCFIILFKILDPGTLSYQSADIFESFWGSIKAAFKIKFFRPDIIFISDHGAPMFFISPLVKAKFVYSAHHNPMRFTGNPLLGNMSEKDAKFATSIEKICTKKCSFLTAPSAYMLQATQDSHDISVKNSVIPNLIDVDFLNSVQEQKTLTAKGKDYKIFIPSAFSVIKGERFVLSIMQHITHALPQKEITFYLSGAKSNKLQFEIEKNPNLKVLILGQREYSENLSYLKSCDLCISPTLLESFGMSILEATLLGVPVVTFDVGGNKELIEEGQNGCLVDYLDLSSLAQKSVALIEHPLDPKQVIAATNNKYSIEKTRQSILELIDELMA